MPMQDPITPPISASAALLAFTVAALGPVAGPWLIILAAGFGGSMVALLSLDTMPSMWVGVRHLVRGTLLAALITGPAAWLIARYGSLPMAEVLGAVAAVVGIKADLVLLRLGQKLPFLRGGDATPGAPPIPPQVAGGDKPQGGQ